jgi:uncharacterized membrane protein
MAGLAYLFLPLTGALAYFRGRTPRVRLHGLQSLILGALWPAALYLGSAISPTVTVLVALAGAVVWVTFFLTALAGRDLLIPGAGPYLERAAGTRSDDYRSRSEL